MVVQLSHVMSTGYRVLTNVAWSFLFTLSNGQFSLCETLVHAEAEVNSKDNNGDTPLQLAIRYVIYRIINIYSLNIVVSIVSKYQNFTLSYATLIKNILMILHVYLFVCISACMCVLIPHAWSGSYICS